MQTPPSLTNTHTDMLMIRLRPPVDPDFTISVPPKEKSPTQTARGVCIRIIPGEIRLFALYLAFISQG